MNFVQIMLLMCGLKAQRPVRRVKRSRSITYIVICKLLAGSGKKRRRGKRGKKRTTYKRKAGAR